MRILLLVSGFFDPSCVPFPKNYFTTDTNYFLHTRIHTAHLYSVKCMFFVSEQHVKGAWV